MQPPPQQLYPAASASLSDARTAQLHHCERLLIDGYRQRLVWEPPSAPAAEANVAAASSVIQGTNTGVAHADANFGATDTETPAAASAARSNAFIDVQQRRLAAEAERAERRRVASAAAVAARRADPVWLQRPIAELERELEVHLADAALVDDESSGVYTRRSGFLENAVSKFFI